MGQVGNEDWCKCGQRKREIREIDSLCCTEIPDVIEDKFEGKKCITLAHEFELLYLNEKRIKNVLVGLREIRGDPLENDKDLHNSCVLQPISNLFGGFFSIWAKGFDELSHPV